jgi:hypothetical protein
MAEIIKKNLNTSPDETRKFEKGKVDVATLMTSLLEEPNFNLAGVG